MFRVVIINIINVKQTLIKTPPNALERILLLKESQAQLSYD